MRLFSTAAAALLLGLLSLIASPRSHALTALPRTLADRQVELSARHGLGFTIRPVDLRPGRLSLQGRHLLSSSGPMASPDADLTAWAPAVRNQGDIGDCVSNATTELVDWYLDRAGQGVPAGFSPMFQYEPITGGQGGPAVGTTYQDNLNIEVNAGAVPVPLYSRGASAAMYDLTDAPQASDFQTAQPYRIQSYQNIFEGQGTPGAVDAIRASLAAGTPVLIALPVYQNFEQYSGQGAIGLPSGPYYGGHAVLALRSDSAGLTFENSWGGTWGNAGYGTLSWDFVAQQVFEAWTITPGQAPQPTPIPPTSTPIPPTATPVPPTPTSTPVPTPRPTTTPIPTNTPTAAPTATVTPRPRPTLMPRPTATAIPWPPHRKHRTAAHAICRYAMRPD